MHSRALDPGPSMRKPLNSSPRFSRPHGSRPRCALMRGSRLLRPPTNPSAPVHAVTHARPPALAKRSDPAMSIPSRGLWRSAPRAWTPYSASANPHHPSPWPGLRWAQSNSTTPSCPSPLNSYWVVAGCGPGPR